MSARDNEKYFWWKKDKNYYSNHKLKALHRMKNGDTFLYLLENIKCESTPYEGILKFSETRAYTIEELAAVADMSVKMVKNGLQALKDLELITIDDSGIIIVNDFDNCIGSETGQTKRKREAKESGNCEVNFTTDLPKNEVKNTLDIRVKSKDIRDKIIYLLSSSKLKYRELGFDKEFDEAESMMIKAAIISERIPSKERIEEILGEVVFKNDLFNKQGYLINCFKNEVNCEYARNDN